MAPKRRTGRPGRGIFSRYGVFFALLIACGLISAPATALAITRDSVLARGQTWVNNPVPYSQSKYYGGYRTDCSGYVSMAWQTGTSWTTATMHDISVQIPKEQLQPGDVLLKASTSTSTGHVRLFYGWADEAHTSYVAYEETRYTGFDGTKSSVKSLATDIADGYKPYRYNKITDSPPPWNALRNPAFDVWSNSAPVWWVYGSTGAGTGWQVRKDQVGSPAFALGLTNLNSASSILVDAGYGSVVEPGKTYTLSAKAGTTASPASVRLRLVVFNAANAVVSDVSTTGDAWGIGAGALKPMSLSTVMPAGATRAVTYLSQAGAVNPGGGAGGTAVFDDVSLYVSSPLPVYRFYSPKNGTHFYTASGPERDMVANTLTSMYTYEGPAYGVVTPANADPLYRFCNRKNGSHFYTASAEECERVKSTLSATYTYDGPAYSVCAAPVAGAIPVYRFYNRKNGCHFYTVSDAERDNVVARLSAIYNLEGIAFYLAQ